MSNKLFNTIILMCFLVGCTTTAPGIYKKVKGVDLENHSIFVLGVSPENFKVSVRSGSISEDGFAVDFWTQHHVSDWPEKGYIIGTARANQTMAITDVTRKGAGSFSLDEAFTACGGAKVLTFNIPKGEVVYIGDISYRDTKNSIHIDYEKNFTQALSYLKNNYPELAEKVKEIDKTAFYEHRVDCGTGGLFIIM